MRPPGFSMPDARLSSSIEYPYQASRVFLLSRPNPIYSFIRPLHQVTEWAGFVCRISCVECHRLTADMRPSKDEFDAADVTGAASHFALLSYFFTLACIRLPLGPPRHRGALRRSRPPRQTSRKCSVPGTLRPGTCQAGRKSAMPSISSQRFTTTPPLGVGGSRLTFRDRIGSERTRDFKDETARVRATFKETAPRAL
jgi:hypothetical protein